jgi:hypothetical protein
VPQTDALPAELLPPLLQVYHATSLRKRAQPLLALNSVGAPLRHECARILANYIFWLCAPVGAALRRPPISVFDYRNPAFHPPGRITSRHKRTQAVPEVQSGLSPSPIFRINCIIYLDLPVLATPPTIPCLTTCNRFPKPKRWEAFRFTWEYNPPFGSEER